MKTISRGRVEWDTEDRLELQRKLTAIGRARGKNSKPRLAARTEVSEQFIKSLLPVTVHEEKKVRAVMAYVDWQLGLIEADKQAVQPELPGITA